jgi:hypothetical protein
MVIIDRASNMAARRLVEDHSQAGRGSPRERNVDYEEWIHGFILVRVFDRLSELRLLKEYLSLPRAQADGYLMEVIANYLDFISDTVTEAMKQLDSNIH